MKQKTILSRKTFARAIVLGIVLLGLVNTSNAQFNYGVKLGTGATCQSDLLEIANNCDTKIVPTFGLIGKYQFTNAFALKSGLEYQQKGRSFDKDGMDLDNKLQYLNVPVKAEFSAGEKAGFKKGQRIFFAAGPYLGYLLDSEGELNGNDINLKDDTKDFDFGLGFEIGFEFPVFTNKSLQLGLNYDMGLVEVYKTNEYKDLHNKMASLNVTLLF